MSGFPPASPSLTPIPRSFKHSLYAMLGIGLVNMLIALDQTIVSTALPSIVSELNGFDYYAWIAVAYLLGSVVSVPVFGRLGDFFGRKPFVVTAIALFILASIACGLAPTIVSLVVARAFQGIAGGMMVGTAFASLADLFPNPRERLKWQVVLAGSYGIATAAGPSLGGFLSEAWGWRSTFLINLPIGLAGLYCVARFLPRFPRASTGPVKLDWLGVVLMGTSLCCLQIFVESVPNHGLSRGNLLLVAGTVLAGAALVLVERRAANPILPLELFAERKYLVMFMLSVICGAVMFSLIFYVPLLLQGGFFLSPREAGLTVTPLPVSIAIGSIINSKIIVNLKRPVSILTVGYGLLLICSVGLVFADRDTSPVILAALLSSGGLGLGFLLNNLNVFGQQIVGRARVGIFTALLQSTRMIGGMLGTAALGALITHGYAARMGTMVHGITGASASEKEWLMRLADPQILVDAPARAAAGVALASAPLAGDFLIETARQTLVGSVHQGLMVLAALIIVALALVRLVPDITLNQKL